MNFERTTRGEKISGLKLASVQYGILFMMLGLAAGLWRLQVLGADNFRVLADQNRIRKVPMLAPRGSEAKAKRAFRGGVPGQRGDRSARFRTALMAALCPADRCGPVFGRGRAA